MWKRAAGIQLMVQRYAGLRTKNPELRLNYKQIDLVRLLKLQTWSYRYRLSIPEILSMVVPSLITVIKEQRPDYAPTGLGVNITTLTGKSAERILRFQINKAYPENEHIHIWLQDEREKCLLRERVDDAGGTLPNEKVPHILDYTDMTAFVTDYKAKMEKMRASGDKARHEDWRKRKAYRGNPFK